MDLDALGCPGCLPVAINSQRVIVGTIGTGASARPFRWSPQAGLHFLPLLPGDTTGGAADINEAGVHLGASGGMLVRWNNDQPTRIQSLVTNGQGWTFTGAVGINNGDAIAGVGMFNGDSHS